LVFAVKSRRPERRMSRVYFTAGRGTNISGGEEVALSARVCNNEKQRLNQNNRGFPARRLAGLLIMADIGTRDERENRMREDWQPGFRAQILRLIGLCMWGVLAQTMLGALAGVIAGMLAGKFSFAFMENMGLFDGLTRVLPEALSYMPFYYMALSALSLMVLGMGIGLRHAMVSGNAAVSRTVLNSALEAAIRTAKEGRSVLERGEEGVSSILLSDLDMMLKARVDVLADLIDGFGVAKYFRRYVSAVVLDYVEEVALAYAKREGEERGDDHRLNKTAIVNIQNSTSSWIRSRTSRAHLMITITFIVIPVVGMLLMFALPAVVSGFIRK